MYRFIDNPDPSQRTDIARFALYMGFESRRVDGKWQLDVSEAPVVFAQKVDSKADVVEADDPPKTMTLNFNKTIDVVWSGRAQADPTATIGLTASAGAIGGGFIGAGIGVIATIWTGPGAVAGGLEGGTIGVAVGGALGAGVGYLIAHSYLGTFKEVWVVRIDDNGKISIGGQSITTTVRNGPIDDPTEWVIP